MAAGLRYGYSYVFLILLIPTVNKMSIGEHMSRLISISNLSQEAMQVGLWFVFFCLAITAHAAHSEEGSFARKKHISTKFVSSGTHSLPSYRLNTHVVLNSSKQAVPAGVGFSSTPRLLLVAEPKNDDWSISIQKQFPSNNDCSHLSSLLCFDSKDEGQYNKLQHDSYWLVLRKTFHF